MKLKPRDIKENTLLTIENKYTHYIFYIVVKKITMRSNWIKIYTKYTYSFAPDGSLIEEKYLEPYEMSAEDFDKRIKLTNKTMTNKINKILNREGKL